MLLIHFSYFFEQQKNDCKVLATCIERALNLEDEASARNQER